MRVEAARVEQTPGGTRLRGEVEGRELFWSVPEDAAFEMRGEPFVCALLPAAMLRGEPLVLPDTLPLEPEFLTNIARLQGIFARWFPGHVPVEIHAPVAPRRVTAVGRATGYSGGIDSSYTLDQLGDCIDTALLIDGIEFREERIDLMTRVEAELAQPLERRHLSLMTVRTNVKTVGRDLGARWSVALGGALASAVHAAGFATYHVAASNSWENLRPYGSHPLTDPLWSSAAVRIHHHGAELRRIEKLEHLAEAPDLLDHLRVCFQGNDYNCGRCQKCLMTMTAMRALGMTSPALPRLDTPTDLRRVEIEHDGDLTDWEELLRPGLDRDDPALHRELRATIRRYKWRRLFRDLDELLTGGRIRTARRSRRA